MRIPQWFVMSWVIICALVGVGGSVLAYTFVRDRAVELDDTVRLPRLWELGDEDDTAPPAASADEFDGDTLASLPEPPAPGARLVLAWPEPPVSVAETAGDVVTPLEGDNSAPDSPPAADAQDTSADAVEPDGAPDGEPDAAEATVLSDEAFNAFVNDPRRKTVLLLGIDQREGEPGPFPTDTIILLSVDPVGKTAAILSVPRDLWVTFPGFGNPGRINQANILGDEVSYPGGGGPALAMKTVQNLLGVRVDYYVLINFEVFTEVIDTVGPIEVCPTQTIHDDLYPDGSYGYITVHFDPGCQDLESERLLQYARVRHGDSEGDIGRSRRQQEVIMATRHKVLTLGGVVALLPKAGDLWSSMQDNIHTNMSFEEILSLARIAEGIPGDNIRQGQITLDRVRSSTTAAGDEVLVPISLDIRLLVQDLFRPAGTPSTLGQ